MELSKLISQLSEELVASTSIVDAEADVYSICFVTPGLEPLRADVLYFGDSTQFGEIDLPPFCNLLFYGSGGDELSIPAEANIIELSSEADPFVCYNLLQSSFLESQQQTDVVRRMMLAHFSNRGLQYLIEEAAAALENPIVVVDNTYRYVAHHLGALEGCDSPLAKSLEDEIRNETLMEETIAYIRNKRIDQQIAQTTGPLVRQNSRLGANTMTAAVMVHGICAAHVMMIEHVRPFTEIDRSCFDRLADFVGQELQKSEVWNPTTGELGAYFLANILNDRTPSEAVTARRIKALNFHPKPHLQVLCIHAKGEGLGQLQAEHIAGQLRPLLHHAIYTRFHRQLVILLSRDDDDGPDEYSLRILSEVCALNDVTCGISNTFGRITQTRAAYDQARRAVRYGERASNAVNDHALFRYSDYTCVHALDLVDRRTNLLSLCHPSLNKLRAYDGKHGGELMETLFCYLQVAGSTTRASKLLVLHKNTLLYRLNRIKQILGTDLSSGEELFQLQLSYRILIYLGLFVPRVAMEREDLRA